MNVSDWVTGAALENSKGVGSFSQQSAQRAQRAQREAAGTQTKVKSRNVEHGHRHENGLGPGLKPGHDFGRGCTSRHVKARTRSKTSIALRA